MPRLARLLVVAALVLLFLTSWTLLPAPNRALLTLAVGAPELSAWLAALSLVVGALSLVCGGGPVPRAALIVAVAAAVLASLPLLQIPSVVRRCDAAMTAALGNNFLQGVPADRMAAMRPSPVVVADLFRGVRVGEARVARDIRFAAPGGVPLTIDVYRPPASGRYPTVVQVYGGAWQRGAPADDGGPATYLASHGFVVFAIDYRHAPKWTWPAQIDDVREALAWVRAHGAEYDADAARLAVIGRSAGAHLALLAAYGRQNGIRAVVSLYGPVDLVEGYRHPPRPDPLDVRSIEEAFLGGTPDQVFDRYRDASPINYVSAQVPPSLLIYGRRDHIVESRFGAALDGRLREAGATSVFMELPWAEHAFDAVPNGPSGQIALYYVERFLAWALTRPQP